MNRFDEAGLRSLRCEMVRKGAAEHMICSATYMIGKGFTAGDTRVAGHYVMRVIGDADGGLEAWLVLDPVLAERLREEGVAEIDVEEIIKHHSDQWTSQADGAKDV